ILQRFIKKFAIASVFLLLAVIVLPACDKGSESKLAEVDGHVISAIDLEKVGSRELFQQRETLFRLEQKKLDEYIGALLLTKEAKARGISVTTLLDQEVNSKVSPVNESEIAAFYEAKKERLPVQLDKVREQIRDYLNEDRREKQKMAYVRSLRAKAKIVTYLKPPPVYRADIAIQGAPSKGPDNAPVTIVKFEDFQCPYCKAVQPTFGELLKRYDGKLRVVHKDLPLEAIHPEAREAAEAARCAGEQGKFWSYHDVLYDRAPKLSVESFKNYAKETNLDVLVFERCLASGKFKPAVQKDLSEAVELGLSGTPAFFINGRELTGAQPIEAFTAIIDDELARSK
ncbi:MAG TPA: thioredoxin domain-containing protein, partial [Terriglobales bacterium]|nr:thioredoxin domain-containing protein [Terriglobales bacterium]